jgi:hypothetical protein
MNDPSFPQNIPMNPISIWINHDKQKFITNSKNHSHKKLNLPKWPKKDPAEYKMEH